MCHRLLSTQKPPFRTWAYSQVRMRELSIEIASVFKPIIDALIDTLGDLVVWFRKLSPEGQRVVRTVALIGAAMMMLLPVIGKVITADRAMIPVLIGLFNTAMKHPFIALAVAIAGVALAYRSLSGSTQTEECRQASTDSENMVR